MPSAYPQEFEVCTSTRLVVAEVESVLLLEYIYFGLETYPELNETKATNPPLHEFEIVARSNCV